MGFFSWKRAAARVIGPTITLFAITFSTNPLYGQATNTFPSNGNAGIGTTSPGYKLDVTGQIRATTGFITPDHSQIGMGNASGTAFFYANDLYDNASVTSANGLYFDVGGSAGVVVRDGAPSYNTVGYISRHREVRSEASIPRTFPPPAEFPRIIPGA